ncbi:TPA: recombinase family protein, partial [Enterococcus hirae]
LCQQHQVQVYSISEPLPASFSHASTNKLFVQLLFTFAEQQRNVIIENVRAGLAYKKQQRQYLSSAVPYGYRLVNGKIQQEAHEAKVVRHIFQLYLTKKYGYKKLCQRLTQQKLFFRERPFQPYHIYSILKNPLYYGEIKGGSLGKYLGTFEPILSKTIF